MEFQYSGALALIATAGYIGHLVFKHFDPWHPLTHFYLLAVVPGSLSPLLLPYFSNVLLAVVASFTTYASSLIISIVIYRLSPFHPLAKYPGPTHCKISKAWTLYAAGLGKQHTYYKQLHEQYGDVVRVGPNELSFCHSDAISPMMGRDGIPKGPYWDGRQPGQKITSLVAIRDPQEHRRRRRLWNRGLSTLALKGYESILAPRVTQLVDSLSCQVGTVDLAQWISYFSYDFMTDMAFGGGTELMRDGDQSGLWRQMESGVAIAHYLGQMPWLGQYYILIPSLGKSLKAFRSFAQDRVSKRRAQGSLTKDLFHHLIDESGIEANPPSIAQVTSDGATAIHAGSDTTATILSNIFWLLLSHPWAYAELQAEVDKYFPPGETALDTEKHSRMEYLNAVINETLRLFPGVPSGSQRAPAKGSGGHAVGSHFVPEGTTAFVHFYSVHRDPRNFSPMPDTFWPNRWLRADNDPTHPSASNVTDEYIHNTDAFIPFSFGPGTCVGKKLAYQKIRMVVCLMLQKLELRFAEGFRWETWEDDLHDYFTMSKGQLPVVITTRA